MKRKYKIAAIVCPLALAVDQLTKTMARSKLAPRDSVDLIPGWLELRYAENTGMAFGMMQGLDPGLRTPLFTIITILAVLIIFHLLRQAPGRSVKLPLGLGFILAGAFGNLVDRFRWGVVVDFIRAVVWPPSNYYWPTFNMADTFITVGIALLVVDTLFAEEEPGGAEQDALEPNSCARPCNEDSAQGQPEAGQESPSE